MQNRQSPSASAPTRDPSEPPHGDVGPRKKTVEDYLIADEDINVEDLARRRASYLQVFEISNEHMPAYPTLREQGDGRPSQGPDAKDAIPVDPVVPFDGSSEPSAYLDLVDKELAKRIPPYTFHSYTIRTRLAFSALKVFDEYVLGWGLLSAPDARSQIVRRVGELMLAFYTNELHTSQPRSTDVAQTSSNLFPSPHAQPFIPITAEVANEWVSNPVQSGLNRYYFTCKEPGEDELSTWRLTGISLQDSELMFNVLMTFEEGGDCDIPYDTVALKELLLNSQIEREIPREGADDEEGEGGNFGFLRSAF
ncbi:hypothetical protein BC834DRAFT_541999 [Gloeopeniophorella convolvens]|nr:hypothetical protein BC834DRAFT_541999 [Gloeopeniophorella convolvens]